MPTTEPGTEHIILQAAEELFMEKGFAATKTTEIAAAAGVNHALLHYYFRTKENLFNKVFEQKVQLLADSFISVLESEHSLVEKIRLSIEAHFDFLAAHPRLPLFILREIVANKERLASVKRMVVPRILSILERIGEEMRTEAAKGSINTIHPTDLLFNAVSLNAFALVFYQILFETQTDTLTPQAAAFLAARRRNNVETILASLRRTK